MDAVEHYRKALELAGHAESAFYAARSYEGDDVDYDTRRSEDATVATEVDALASLAAVHMQAARLLFDVDGRRSFADPAELARWDAARTTPPGVGR